MKRVYSINVLITNYQCQQINFPKLSFVIAFLFLLQRGDSLDSTFLLLVCKSFSRRIVENNKDGIVGIISKH